MGDENSVAAFAGMREGERPGILANSATVEFPTKSGHEVKGYSDCSYSAGETYSSDE